MARNTKDDRKSWPTLDSVPEVTERRERLDALKRQHNTLTKRSREIEAELTDLRQRHQADPHNPDVEALVTGRTVEDPAPTLRQELQDCYRQAKHVEAALKVVGEQVRDAEARASREVNHQLQPEHDALLREACEAGMAFVAAVRREQAWRDELQRHGVQIEPSVLGGLGDKVLADVARALRPFRERFNLDESALPQLGAWAAGPSGTGWKTSKGLVPVTGTMTAEEHGYAAGAR